MVGGRVIRVTMFKITSSRHIPTFIENYRILSQTAVKDGKPYILSLHAGPTKEDQRNQGYTFAAKSEFSNMDDMKYYDTECVAHQEFKDKAKGLFEGIMTIFYEPEVVSVLKETEE